MFYGDAKDSVSSLRVPDRVILALRRETGRGLRGAPFLVQGGAGRAVRPVSPVGLYNSGHCRAAGLSGRGLRRGARHV